MSKDKQAESEFTKKARAYMKSVLALTAKATSFEQVGEVAEKITTMLCEACDLIDRQQAGLDSLDADKKRQKENLESEIERLQKENDETTDYCVELTIDLAAKDKRIEELEEIETDLNNTIGFLEEALKRQVNK